MSLVRRRRSSGFAEEKGVKAGALINGSRVALTGQGVAPSLFAVMAALGKDRVVKRLKAVNEVNVVSQ
jgi:glutamyl-tRNA synthetase